MKKGVAIIGLLFVASVAVGQQIPRAEIFYGVSYLNLGAKAAGERASLLGFEFASDINLGGSWSITSSVAAQFAGSTDPHIHHRLEAYQFLAGPRYTFRRDKCSPFVHALIGTSRGELFSLQMRDTRFSHFTYGIGGGVDVPIRPRIALRILQLDYVHSSISPLGENNIRGSAGVVFRLGGR